MSTGELEPILTTPHPFLEVVADTLPANSDILELGCNTGDNCRFLRSLGHFVVGIDPSHDDLTEAGLVQTKMEVGTPSVFLVDSIPPQRNVAQFDVVISLDTFITIPQADGNKTIDFMMNHTRPGGLNIVRIPRSAEEVDGVQRFIPFDLDELIKKYGPSWTMLVGQEAERAACPKQSQQAVEYVGRKNERPSTPSQKEILLSRAAAISAINPSGAAELRRQALSLKD